MQKLNNSNVIWYANVHGRIDSFRQRQVLHSVNVHAIVDGIWNRLAAELAAESFIFLQIRIEIPLDLALS